MTEVTDVVIDRMVQTLVAEADPEMVILFGSRARGDFQMHSDVDLIVVEAAPFGPERSRTREMLRLRSALRPFAVPLDVLVYSQEDVDYWRDSLNYVLAPGPARGPGAVPAPHRMSDPKCARHLLDAAERDIRTLRGMAARRICPPFSGDFGGQNAANEGNSSPKGAYFLEPCVPHSAICESPATRLMIRLQLSLAHHNR